MKLFLKKFCCKAHIQHISGCDLELGYFGKQLQTDLIAVFLTSYYLICKTIHITCPKEIQLKIRELRRKHILKITQNKKEGITTNLFFHSTRKFVTLSHLFTA
uniref:(northern house mosquito) hypothetical protein n=1 Tax=Culex pipiens TaxID=7175 RepID=A0A8D8G4G3_CULPI